MLTASCVGVTLQTFHGLGRHIWDIYAENEDINTITLTGLLSVTFIICSSVWSKTSWGITLLRITEGKMRLFIMFFIVSMNILFAVAALVYWIPCTPIEKVWRPLTPGTCVDPQQALTWGIIASGMSRSFAYEPNPKADTQQSTLESET